MELAIEASLSFLQTRPWVLVPIYGLVPCKTWSSLMNSWLRCRAWATSSTPLFPQFLWAGWLPSQVMEHLHPHPPPRHQPHTLTSPNLFLMSALCVGLCAAICFPKLVQTLQMLLLASNNPVPMYFEHSPLSRNHARQLTCINYLT